MVAFTYDNRARLIGEERIGGVGYELDYLYDQGGNRTRKVDTLNQRKVVYHYDLEDPTLYESDNNRLEFYETFDTLGTSDPLDDVLRSTTWYYYNESGNVMQVVTNVAGTDRYDATRLVYAGNGQAVTFVLGETWEWDRCMCGDACCADPCCADTCQGEPCPQQACPTNYAITHAREFRYDGARQRYLDRELDPQELLQGNVVAISDTWSDYDGDEVYGDFTVTPGNPPTVTNVRSFTPGLAKVDPFAEFGGAATTYYHADMIGTTRTMSDSLGNGASPVAYTAFGERIDGASQRYGYAGAWAYQTDEESDPDLRFPFLHVGARYYDPATGRFLQRDPIGIRGGLNVYAYVWAQPTVRIDPDGMTVVTAALPIAGGAAAADGPLPIGDAIGAAILTVAACVDLAHWFAHRSKKRKSTRDRHTRRHSSKRKGRRGRRKPPGYSRSPGRGNPVPPTCFPAGTLVQGENGQTPIEVLRVGSTVCGRDLGSRSPCLAKVTAVHGGCASQLVLIGVGHEGLRSTSEHPFWVKGRGWVKAQHLKVGDELEKSDGRAIAILSVDICFLEESVPVYNITVDGDHTYFVGTTGVRVHNKIVGY